MRHTIDSLRARTERAAIAFRGIVRRLAVGVTSASNFWQLVGFDGAYGESETLDEVEAFQGVGFVARPKPGSSAEAVVVCVGGESGHPVIVATRDKATEIQVEADETAIYNSTGAVVRITKDGDIVVRCKAGRTVSIDDGSGAVPLATKADVDALRTTFNLHTHASHGAVTTEQAAAPAGTSVLRGK